MKLPKGRKERMQIAVAAVVAGLAVCYGAIQFMVVPMVQSYSSTRKDIRDLDEKIAAGNKEVGRLGQLRDQDETLRTELLSINRNYVLEPEFGNYLIRAQQAIERLATSAGVKVESVAGVGETSMPQHGSHRNAFRAYLVRVSTVVSGERGYEDMLGFLATVENGNPYSTISSLQISPRPDFAQSVSFNVSWPIWEDSSVVKSFESRSVASPEPGKKAETPRPGGERT